MNSERLSMTVIVFYCQNNQTNQKHKNRNAIDAVHDRQIN